jgi:hypothetical protein
MKDLGQGNDKDVILWKAYFGDWQMLGTRRQVSRMWHVEESSCSRHEGNKAESSVTSDLKQGDRVSQERRLWGRQTLDTKNHLDSAVGWRLRVEERRWGP